VTPDTGEEHMYWALILRGVGLGLLFRPYYYFIAFYQVKNIGEGAAFTGMMRQLGGLLVLPSLLLLSLDSVRTPRQFDCAFR
jgi:hypothetical protein